MNERSGRAGSLLRLVLAVALMGACTNGSATGNDAVSASVVAKCSVVASTFAFGAYDPLVTNKTTALTASAPALSVSCTRGATGVTVQLDNGSNSSHASGTCASATCTRAMKESNNGTDYLSYDLYTSSAHTTVWNTANTVSYTPTSMAATNLTVYGLIAAGQNVTVSNSYSDSVTATVNF